MAGLDNFLRRWGRGLERGLPSFLTAFLGLERNAALIAPVDGRYRLFQVQGTRVTPKGETEEASDLDHRLAGPVGVLVPDELVMSVDLTVPQSAKRTLHQVVEMEVERKTPFKASDVLYAYSVEKEEAGEITLSLRLVPKARLDELLTPLREAGVEIAALHLVPPGTLEEGFALVQPGHRAAYRVSWASVLALSALLLITAASLVLHQQKTLEEFRAEAERLGPKVQRVQTVRGEFDRLIQQQQALRAFAEGRRNPLETLSKLSGTLPDSAWLTSASLTKGEAKIEGFATDASQAVSALAGISGTSPPKLLAPITKGPSGLGERFLLSLELD